MGASTFKIALRYACVAALLTGGGSASAQITAKLGHSYPAEHPQGVAMQKFAELIDTYTNKRVKVTVHHSAALGGDDKMVTAVQAGTQELYIGGISVMAGRVKEVQVFDLPFLFQNKKEVDFVLNGPVGNKLLGMISATGVEAMAWSETGFRHLTNSKRAVRKAEDIKGLKIRVLQNPVALETWKVLGASPTPMSFSELFSAMEIKAIDGQENPLQTIATNKFYEVQKYATLTGHVYSPVTILASRKFMGGLTPDDQKAVRRAAVEAAKYQRDLMDEADLQVEAKLKEQGMVIDRMPAEELAKLQQMVRPVTEKFTAVIGADFVREFQAEIEKARNGK